MTQHSPLLMTLATLIVLAAILAAGYLIYLVYLQNSPHPQVVLVSGSIRTLGLTTIPTAVSFYSGPLHYSTTVVAGRYALTLLGNNFYNVSVYYQSLAGFGSGSCRAGMIGLTGNATLLTQNLSC